MPKLLIFAACEKAIISQGDSTPSLIAMFQQINIPMKGMPEPLPEKPIVPFRWAVFAEWLFEEKEIGKHFEYRLEFKSEQEDGDAFFANASELHADKRIMRAIGSLEGFPLVPPGEYRLLASIRQKGEDQWDTQGNYPVTVTHI